jgi:hypothetical protein
MQGGGHDALSSLSAVSSSSAAPIIIIAGVREEASNEDWSVASRIPRGSDAAGLPFLAAPAALPPSSSSTPRRSMR